jgi:hypothetical protein
MHANARDAASADAHPFSRLRPGVHDRSSSASGTGIWIAHGSAGNPTVLDRIVMNTFAPEFAQFWLAGLPAMAVADPGVVHQDDDDLERAALEALAERVFAARSIV